MERGLIMKKILSLILVLVMCLSLYGCGGNNVEEQAASAPSLNLQTYRDMREENKATADAEYDGNIYRYTGIITEVNSTYCVAGTYEGSYEIDIYLEQEDLLKLNTGEMYTFAGVFESEALVPNLNDAILIDE